MVKLYIIEGTGRRCLLCQQCSSGPKRISCGPCLERRVGLLGRSLDIMVRSAKHSGVFEPKVPIIDAEHLGYLPENEVLAVATGTQGEIGAALHRLMMDTHPHLSLGEGDTVIFSSKTIPGNEESVPVDRRFEGSWCERDSCDDAATTLHASGHPARMS